ncbi:sodium/proton antiporter, NhaD family [Sulfuricurvum kujiense DSM 16994]|uniref:Sodium/proton antiporter, NhaD family n=1 Tax=Sulfuricurvum kujiense (strain ATCC BAA-921 / DSM 16994 / JCM 11577 / YK-1) TaxID=709032 RepID=E4TYM0_SULKY|nr:sodium:proton antiporter NhaD [Sulfuricurvum kujiense]ADR32997.1 sodium/proton antiporter, NhaD family [Sulfuricurvum kujiense DSM 16994]
MPTPIPLDGIDLSTHPFGWLLLFIFIVGYYFIATEEKYHIDKAKPALFIGTLMYIMIGGFYAFYGLDFIPFKNEITHLVFEIAQIFFFLYVAMTFVEALIERGVFNALKGKLIAKGYNYRELFWITGFLAFFLSPIADNLTTALILSTVLVTIEKKNRAFLIPGAINVVVASNAGGAWSPFGDITTLMAWTAQKGEFSDFLYLFPASFLGWIVTAYLLSRYVPDFGPNKEGNPGTADKIEILKGGKIVIAIGIATIAISVIAKQMMQLPPMWGMLFGLSVLQLYMYSLKRYHKQDVNIFRSISKIENNTLLFFFGILAAVGALYFAGFLGYVTKLYDTVNPTYINIGVGFVSAVIDNVPVMSAILKSNPAIDFSQWMLLTLTVGVGGSLISFGSAAGVGVMGRMHGIYTFASHMKLAWTVLIGYIVSIAVWYLQFIVLGID